MADFEIRSKKVKNELQAWDTVRVQMERNREKVATIRNTLSLNSTAKRNIEMSLSKTADTLQKIINGSQAMKTALADSVMEYESTEQSLLQQKVLKDILEQKSDTPFQNFNENFWSNFWDSLRDALLEGTGNTIVKVGGLLNIATATARGVGNNAFVIVNPNVAKVTGKMFSVVTPILPFVIVVFWF